MYTGPKLTNDNLVFGYDTGYGVADNGVETRFYKGEPASNVQDSDISAMTQTGFNNWGAYDGNNTPYHTYSSTTQTKTLVNITGPDGELTNAMLYHNVSGGSFGPTNWSAVPSANLANGEKITLQAWVKAADSSSVGKSVRPHLYYGKVGGGSYSASTNHSLTMEWQLVKHCYTVPEGAASNGTFYLFTGGGETKMYVTKTAIIPNKLHSVAWLQGGTTRSDTNSLIDLKRTTDIDLSNISFDSTGQPTFDGTDDYIQLPSSIRNYFLNSNVAVEIVLKKSSAQQGNYVVFDVDVTRWNLNYNLYTSGQWSFDFYDGTEHVISAGNYDNEYVHFVLQQLASGDMEIYANGVLKGTQSANNLAPNSSNPRIGSRTNGDYKFPGEIPVIRIYNNALSAAEVLQNYNAYKNRFNI